MPISPVCPYCQASPFKTLCASHLKHIEMCRKSFESGLSQQEEKFQKLQDEKLIIQDTLKDLKARLSSKNLDLETSAILKTIFDKQEALAKSVDHLSQEAIQQLRKMKEYVREQNEKTREVVVEKTEEVKETIHNEMKNMAQFLVAFENSKNRSPALENQEKYARRYLMNESNHWNNEGFFHKKHLDLVRKIPLQNLTPQFLGEFLAAVQQEKVRDGYGSERELAYYLSHPEHPNYLEALEFIEMLKDIATLRMKNSPTSQMIQM